MSEVFDISTPPNLIDATLVRVNEPIETDQPISQNANPSLPLMRWLAAAMIVLALGLSVYVMWQPSGMTGNGSSLLAAGEVPTNDEIDKIKEFIRSAHGASARYLNNPRPGGSPMLVPIEENKLAGVLEAISDAIEATPEDIAKWEPTKEAVLQFSDGTAVLQYDSGEIISLKLPGWKSARDYETDSVFADTLQYWIEKSTMQRSEPPPEISEITEGVIREWTGSDSAVKKPEVRFATDQNAWMKVWNDHMPYRTRFVLPDVDFEKQLVVVVFGGEMKGALKYSLHAVLHFQPTVRIRLLKDESDKTTTPFGFWVFDADFVPEFAAIELDTPKEGGRYPVWQTLRKRSGVAVTGSAFSNEWTNLRLFEDESSASGSFKATVELLDDYEEENGRSLLGNHVLTTQNEFKELFKIVAEKDFDRPEILDVDFRKHWVFASIRPGASGPSAFKKIQLVGSNSNSIHFRVGHEVSVILGLWQDYGFWVLPRDDRIWVQEVKDSEASNPNDRWAEKPGFRVVQKFGVVASETAYDGQHTAAGYHLVKDAKTLADLSMTSGVKLPEDFADFDKEMVLVILDQNEMLFEGMSIEVDGENKITYSVAGPSGVNPGFHSQVGFFVLPKHDKPISLYRSVTVGPSQPSVKLVKEFE
ncbi:hypothetical protein OAU50_04290 [Planctomycetota bacterium]|nr:hypothetical protein [Planctomycetota bacterium]